MIVLQVEAVQFNRLCRPDRPNTLETLGLASRAAMTTINFAILNF
jgi:hypothetical protein